MELAIPGVVPPALRCAEIAVAVAVATSVVTVELLVTSFMVKWGHYSAQCVELVPPPVAVDPDAVVKFCPVVKPCFLPLLMLLLGRNKIMAFCLTVSSKRIYGIQI